MRTNRVIATLVVGIEPEGVAISPDGRWVYVTSESSSNVSVIDTRTNKIRATFPVGARPRAAAFSPAGLRAYVTAENGGTVAVESAGLAARVKYLSHGETYDFEIPMSRVQTASE